MFLGGNFHATISINLLYATFWHILVYLVSKYGKRIFSYVHSFVTRVGKGRARSGYEKGRVRAGAGARTRRART